MLQALCFPPVLCAQDKVTVPAHAHGTTMPEPELSTSDATTRG